MSGTTSTTGAPGSTGATHTPGTARRAFPLALHGLPWLVWRRHRTVFRIGLLVTVLACAYWAYQRTGVLEFLHERGSSPDSEGNLTTLFQSRFGSLFDDSAEYLGMLPAAVAVFVGAPLIAREQEQGTLKLVTTQSASRGRWLAATLALPLAFATVCTTVLALAFHWLWEPAHEMAMTGDWLTGGAFETTGPVLVAMTLFLTVCGIALGMLVKRVVTAMALTAVLALATNVIWAERLRVQLGTLRSVSYPYNGDFPALPADTARIDDWVSTAGGKLYGYGTCVSGDTEACRAKLGIVNRVVQYYDYGQMAGMQWLGAGILLALAALVLAFVVWRARRRPF